ncbi:sugar kinase [Acidisoma sp. L85]|uniref:sugar kinase n=1 Tax=Acidisoma sp. L85 TaxID=1641850 RepID=UPI00131B8ADF|nr:sugar kinase [Acidisoma sp. L85]
MIRKIVCVGGAVVDFIYGVEQLPSVDGKFLATSFAESGGGMAANAAVIVSRLGAQAYWCGRLGDDDKGRIILSGLQSEGVDTSLSRLFTGAQSSHSLVLNDREGNRAIILYRSGAIDPDPGWLPLQEISSGDAVLADNRWVDGAVAALKAAAAKGLPGILDADGAGDKSSLPAVAAASHAIFSEPGLASLFGAGDPAAGLHEAARHSPFVAVTLGERGVLWFGHGNGMRHMPAFKIDAVETVGAGDIFHGAFTLALVEGCGEEVALRFASATAALKCGREGGRASFPSRREVEEFLRQN